MGDEVLAAHPRTTSPLGDNIEDILASMEISAEDSMKVFGGAGTMRIFPTVSGMNEASSESAG